MNMTGNDNDLLEMLLHLCKQQEESDNLSALSTLDCENLMCEMEREGFDRQTVLSALDWLKELFTELKDSPVRANSMRVYTRQELVSLGADACNCLMRLESIGILSPITRERVIEQVLSLRAIGVESNLVKWVTYLVLCTHSKQEPALGRMELFLTDQFIGGMQ